MQSFLSGFFEFTFLLLVVVERLIWEVFNNILKNVKDFFIQLATRYQDFLVLLVQLFLCVLLLKISILYQTSHGQPDFLQWNWDNFLNPYWYSHYLTLFLFLVSEALPYQLAKHPADMLAFITIFVLAFNGKEILGYLRVENKKSP